VPLGERPGGARPSLTNMEAELGMTCVDCGGTLHPLSYPPEDGWEPGDVVAYRCPDCNERFDIVMPDLEDDDRH
jgi:hypothetical protein